MADFHQTGVVTTLHRLKPNNIDRLEADLEKFTGYRPIGLVLPALYLEFETLAMQHIVSELKRVRYLQRIVVVVGRATLDQFNRAQVDVEIEAEAHAEQDVGGVPAVFDARVAERPGEDGVVLRGQHLKRTIGHRDACCQVLVSAPVERSELNL